MSKLISSIELKKADGAPIKFNFQFENGLPVKPIIEPSYEIWFSEKINKYGITMTMNSKYEINDLTLSNISYHYTSVEMKDIWIHLPTSYLVIREINNKLIENMKVNGLAIVFVDENGNEL